MHSAESATAYDDFLQPCEARFQLTISSFFRRIERTSFLVFTRFYSMNRRHRAYRDFQQILLTVNRAQEPLLPGPVTTFLSPLFFVIFVMSQAILSIRES